MRIVVCPVKLFKLIYSREHLKQVSDVVSLLSEIRLVPGKTDCLNGIRTANILAVIAAAASGSNIKMAEAGNLDILSTGIVSANVKFNYAR